MRAFSFGTIACLVAMVLSAVGYYVPAAAAPLVTQAASPTPAPSSTGEPQPTRIEFKPGAAAATVEGHVEAAGTNRYTVAAAQGQTMWVTVTAIEGAAILVIWGADGTVLISDHADATSWNGDLPSTQDYEIDVNGDPDSATTYTLQVVIPPTTTGKTREVDDRASGSEIALSSGDQLAVTLDSNPSTGYVWEIRTVDAAVLQPVGEWEYTAASKAMGAGGQETRRFVALAPGQTSLQLEYHRPWEGDAPPAKMFEVTVTVS